MKQELRWLGVCLALLTFGPAAMGGFQKTALSQRLYKIPKAPNALMKTRENSMYLHDRVIVKLRASSVVPGVPGRSGFRKSFGIASLDKFVEQYSAKSVENVFSQKVSASPKAGIDLSQYFVVKYSSPVDAFAVAKEIATQPDVEYAEPWFIYALDGSSQFTPSDTSFSKQWGAKKIKADSAWSVNQGDSTVVLGIVDTGIQYDHPDLAGNIWTNSGETGMDGLGRDRRTNGVDDDDNGLIDDWQGWDFGGADFNDPVGDNNPHPTASNNAHATHVSGLASARTNNVTGIAGIGFKCKLLNVKATADNDFRGDGPSALIIMGYEGIIYAAFMGAKVINCSWGGEGYSQFEQDVIDYATAQGALVVAAAGNSSGADLLVPTYPGAYANAICVAGTANTDAKTYYSKYGSFIDVCAPGGTGTSTTQAIYSTQYPNTYGTSIGTSSSTPHVTGLAGLIQSRFPWYTPLQVGEQLRITCDDNSAINGPSLYHQLGNGRVNAMRALTETSLPSVRITSYFIKDSAGGNNDGIPEPNETIDLFATFTNYLHTTDPGTVISLTSADTNVQVLDGAFALGALPTLESAANTGSPFRFLLKGHVPPDRVIDFTLTMQGGSYSDFQIFSLGVYPSFATQDINDVRVTFTRDGRLGFNDFLNHTQGVGFVYDGGDFPGGNYMYEGGLLIGYSPVKLVDVVRNDLNDADADFASSGVFTLRSPGAVSDQDGNTAFTDDNAAAANKVGVQVNMSSYSFADVPNRDYVLTRYDIRNTSGAPLSNLYASLFFDWDMLAPVQEQSATYYDNNRTSYDASRGLGYAWYDTSAPTIYCGVRALTGPSVYHAIIRDSSSGTRADKWRWISGATQLVNSTNDIMFFLSSGPFTIPAGGTKMIGYALLAGAGLSGLQSHADAALTKWQLITAEKDPPSLLPETYALSQNYPNPFNPQTRIRFSLPHQGTVRLTVYNVLGQSVRTLVDAQRNAGSYEILWDGNNDRGDAVAGGVYFCRIEVADAAALKFVATEKMVVMK